MVKTAKLSAALLTLVCLWCRGAQEPAQESLEALRKRAEKGSPEAPTALGTMYRNGSGRTSGPGRGGAVVPQFHP
jgi:TPR repeat protein